MTPAATGKNDLCMITPEMGISRDSLSNLHPVAFNGNFNDSTIKEIWDLDPEVAMKYIYVDREILERNYPGIEKTYKDTGFPWGKLRDHREIPGSKWKDLPVDALHLDFGKTTGNLKKGKFPLNSEILVKTNGGWIVDEGGHALHPVMTGDRIIKSTKACGKLTEADGENTVQACQLLSAMVNIQGDASYNFRVPLGAIRVKKTGDTLQIKVNPKVIGDKAGDLLADVSDYRLSLNLDPKVTYWIKTIDLTKIQKAIKDIGRLYNQASRSGMSIPIDDHVTLQRWSDNVIAAGEEGKGSITIPFFPNLAIVDPEFNRSIASTSFVKHDFMKNGEDDLKQCSASGVALVDHEGKFVPYMARNGKKSMNVLDIIKDTPVAMLKKWKWTCLPRARNVDRSVIPVTIKPGRRTIKSVSGLESKLDVTKKDINDAMKEIAMMSWNAIVKSRMDHAFYDVRVTPYKEQFRNMPREILDDMTKFSGKANTREFQEMVETMPREPLVVTTPGDNIEVIETPFVVAKGKWEDTHGLPDKSPVSSIIKKGNIIVGVEDGLFKAFDDC